MNLVLGNNPSIAFTPGIELGFFAVVDPLQGLKVFHIIRSTVVAGNHVIDLPAIERGRISITVSLNYGTKAVLSPFDSTVPGFIDGLHPDIVDLILGIGLTRCFAVCHKNYLLVIAKT